MHTRAPPAVGTEWVDDRVRLHTGVCEPFTLQIRRLGEGRVKLIWWFAAAVDEETPPMDRAAQEKDRYAVEFYSYTEVLDKLTFQMDRDMVKKAIELVKNTYRE